MKIGFMQGRLCDQVNGKIQAFPWRDWESEFLSAQQLGIFMMEWTLDQERLYDNPFMTSVGQHRILHLTQQTGVQVCSLTGDCFMQSPFFKADTTTKRNQLLSDLEAILESAAVLGLRYVVIPLVDNGALTNSEEQLSLMDGLLPLREGLKLKNLKILFESDFPPARLAHFMKEFPSDTFGLNYDIGNSASLGYNTKDEIASYGHRIDNVHIKDRLLGGSTVPLGTGNANFPATFRALFRTRYSGSFILQTARASDGNHVEAIKRYQHMTLKWWDDCES